MKLGTETMKQDVSGLAVLGRWHSSGKCDSSLPTGVLFLVTTGYPGLRRAFCIWGSNLGYEMNIRLFLYCLGTNSNAAL